MRPFPADQIVQTIGHAKGIAVIDRDISFGYEGTVFTNVNSALTRQGNDSLKLNFIAGLGGRDISKDTIRSIFYKLKDGLEGAPTKTVEFLNLNVEIDE